MTSENVKCEPCEHKGISKLANEWCNECAVGYCDQCVKHHTKIKQLRLHHLIPVADRAKGMPVVCEICPAHNITYDSFCAQHDSILCRICFQTDHSECEILDLDEACKMSKQSTSLLALETNFDNIDENLTRGIEQRQETESKMQQEKQTIQKQVDEICAKFLKNADNLEEKLLDDLKGKVDKVSEEKKLERVVLVNTKITTKEVEDGITSLKRNATDKQVFLAIQNNQSKLLRDKNAAVLALGRCSDFEIGFRIAESNFGQTESFGEVIITKDIKPFEFSELNKSQAQLHVHATSQTHEHDDGKSPTKKEDIRKLDDDQASQDTLQPDMNTPTPKFENCQIKLKQRIRIGDGSTEMSLTSCALLPNRKMVFVDDHRKRIIVHKRKGEYQTHILMERTPFDVSAVDDNKVAVTFFEGINIVNVDTEIIEQTICLEDKQCFGISFSDDKLYVMTSFNEINGEILVLDLQGTILNRINVGMDKVYNLVVHKNNIYYTDLKSHRLYACDISGQQLWMYKDPRLKPPRCFRNNFSNALSVDNHGNIFLALPDSDKILLISSDGISKQCVLDWNNFLKGPSGLSFLTNTYQLLTCNATNGNAALFDI